jgi:hypothetical protein
LSDATTIDYTVLAPATTRPSATAPSNQFTIDGYTHGKNGAITLTINVPGPGSVSVLGTHSDPIARSSQTASTTLTPGYRRLAWTRRSATASKAGRMRITLQPDAAGTRMLRYARGQGWALHLRVWTTYTPSGGRARNTTTTIRVLTAKSS